VEWREQIAFFPVLGINWKFWDRQDRRRAGDL